MKQIPVGDYLLIGDLPEGGKNYRVQGLTNVTKIYFTHKRKAALLTTLPLSWSIIGLASELSPEQWAEIVENEYDYDYNDEGEKLQWRVYKDYEVDEFQSDTPTASGLSLLKSKGFNLNTLILKKKI